jgi:hypothetical protein
MKSIGGRSQKSLQDQCREDGEMEPSAHASVSIACLLPPLTLFQDEVHIAFLLSSQMKHHLQKKIVKHFSWNKYVVVV